LLFSAPDAPTLRQRVTVARDAYLNDTSRDLASLAQSNRAAALPLPHRAFAVWRDRDDAAKVFPDSGRPGITLGVCDRPTGAPSFLFPGFGEHYPGMGRELYRTFAEFRHWVDRCCEHLETDSGLSVLSLITEDPAADAGSGDSRRVFARMVGREPAPSRRSLPTELAHPSTFVLEFSLVQLLRGLGVRPRALLGHSLGEYVAACVSGVMTLRDALRVVATRARLMRDVPPGAMLAVQSGANDLRMYSEAGVTLAAVNSDSSSVLVGPEPAIAAVARSLMGAGIACRYVETAQGFHSLAMASIAPSVRELVASVPLSRPAVPFVSNVTGSWITDAEAQAPDYWVRHMCSTVQFAGGAETLFRLGHHVILEVGPGQSLASFVKQHRGCTREQAATTVSVMPSRHYAQSELATFLACLGQLWMAGVNLDWTGVLAEDATR